MSTLSSVTCSLVAPNLNTTAASVSGQSRDGALTISSRDYKPRDTLINPTQARIHDRLAWEMQFALAHRQYFYTRPAENDTYVPSPSLLTTTEARNNDARAWNEHVQQLHTPAAINTNLPPVKEHVLRLTKARLHEIYILQARAAARERARFPRPPRYVLSTFMPSAHLLSSTTARRLDSLAWQTAQEQASWQFSAAKALSMAPLSEHLLLPTQSQLAATRAWADERREAKIAADIWWEERRPAPSSDYHRRHAAQLPSKVLEVTVAFSLSMRAKHCDEVAALDADADEERRALSALRLSMPPIAHSSHLLTETTATVQCRWLHASEPVASPTLQLPSQATYPAQSRVQSKLYSETAASHHHRYCQRRHRASHWRRIRALTDDDAAARLLRTTRAVCYGQRAAFAGHVRDQREQRWNVHTTRGRIAENPFEHGGKLFRPHHDGGSSGARRATVDVDPAATATQKSLRDRHASWTSTEVRAVVAKAVHAALAAAQTQPPAAPSKRRPSAASAASCAPSVVSAAASRRSSVSAAAAASTTSSTLAAREQLKAQRRAENPFASSLAKSTLWSTPAKKPTAAAPKAPKTTAKATKPTATPPSLQKKPSLQIFTEDKARSLQEKLHSFMMLSPVHAAAGDSGVLVFRDLSHCVSPMTTRDAVDRDADDCDADEDEDVDVNVVVAALDDAHDDAWPLWNLSAATVDQHAAPDDVSPRVSLETTAVHPAGVSTAAAAIAPFSPAAVKVAAPMAASATNKAAAMLALKMPQDSDVADGDVSDDETVVVQQPQPSSAAGLDTSLVIA